LYFTYSDDTRKHTLEEVLELREEAWFRRGVALSPECNKHIVEASIKYLGQMRERAGFAHQIIGVACSVDHARQVRSLYEERGLRAQEIHSAMDREKQEAVLENLRRGKIQCIVQVQMLGEGFDHPPLSVAAIFRPFRSLSPYIQFVGRVMRVVHESKPEHPDNHAFIVSHVGLSNDEHWDDFRELDFDDQRMIREWINGEKTDPGDEGEPTPRRFDDTLLVDNEIIGDFISKSFLDPDDDRVLDEFLNREVFGGIQLRKLMSREELKKRLLALGHDASSDEAPVKAVVQPQRRRVEARKRLNERAKSVSNRILKELALSGVGREIGRAIKSVRGQPNLPAMIELMNRRINEHVGISPGQRASISADQAEDVLAALDMLGDLVRDEINANRR
jgi:superfamily II DNA or RNA helicase